MCVGVVAPVVRDVQNKGLLAIGADVKSLAKSAKNGTLTTDDVAGATFTMTNLGAYGVRQFNAIVTPPQVCTGSPHCTVSTSRVHCHSLCPCRVVRRTAWQLCPVVQSGVCVWGGGAASVPCLLIRCVDVLRLVLEAGWCVGDWSGSEARRS